jgi:hypothetical protein
MESDHRDDDQSSEPRVADRSASNAEQAPFTPPFASEGLEQVRDSHC